MAKRFRDNSVWKDYWFINLFLEYKLFWIFLNDECDHSGIWKPNWIFTGIALNLNIDKEDFLEKINESKIRIRVLANGKWLLTGFFPLQYKTTFIVTNKAVYSEG